MMFIYKKSLLLIIVVYYFLLIPCQNSYADFTHVYIDPGHGGDKPGCTTSVAGYAEKDINLSVALEVKEWLDNYGLFTAMYSRLIDTTVANTQRAYEANGAGCSTYVAIHHNCYSPCPQNQYTVAIYSTLLECDGAGNPWFGTTRNTTSLLARKLGLKIRDAFHYDLHEPLNSGDTFTVLSRTYMASTITEASFICRVPLSLLRDPLLFIFIFLTHSNVLYSNYQNA